MRQIGLVMCTLLAGAGAAISAGGPASAQTPGGQGDGTVLVSLVRQDFSDCNNGNVSTRDPSLVQGTAWVTRQPDGTTAVKVGLTVQPKTTYHFYLKCVRQLGDIVTDEEGIGSAVFSFPTNAVGSVYAFDMYPQGAPLGNKFQSVQVSNR